MTVSGMTRSGGHQGAVSFDNPAYNTTVTGRILNATAVACTPPPVAVAICQQCHHIFCPPSPPQQTSPYQIAARYFDKK